MSLSFSHLHADVWSWTRGMCRISACDHRLGTACTDLLRFRCSQHFISCRYLRGHPVPCMQSLHRFGKMSALDEPLSALFLRLKTDSTTSEARFWVTNLHYQEPKTKR